MEIKQIVTFVKIPQSRKAFEGKKIGKDTYLTTQIGSKTGELNSVRNVEAKADASTFGALLRAAWEGAKVWDPTTVYESKEVRDAAFQAHLANQDVQSQLGQIRDASVWASKTEREKVLRAQERAREQMRRGRRK